MKKQVMLILTCASFMCGAQVKAEDAKSGWFPWIKESTPYYESATQMKIEQNEMEQKQVRMKIQQLEQQISKSEMNCERAQGYTKSAVCDFASQDIPSKEVEKNILQRRLDNLQKKHTELMQKRMTERNAKK